MHCMRMQSLATAPRLRQHFRPQQRCLKRHDGVHTRSRPSSSFSPFNPLRNRAQEESAALAGKHGDGAGSRDAEDDGQPREGTGTQGLSLPLRAIEQM